MQDAELIETIHRKYAAILMDLDERGTRRWAAAEAMSLGWGGLTAVALTDQEHSGSGTRAQAAEVPRL